MRLLAALLAAAAVLVVAYVLVGPSSSTDGIQGHTELRTVRRADQSIPAQQRSTQFALPSGVGDDLFYDDFSNCEAVPHPRCTVLDHSILQETVMNQTKWRLAFKQVPSRIPPSFDLVTVICLLYHAVGWERQWGSGARQRQVHHGRGSREDSSISGCSWR